MAGSVFAVRTDGTRAKFAMGDPVNRGLISANSISDTGLSPIVGFNDAVTNSRTISIAGGAKFTVGFAAGTTGVT